MARSAFNNSTLRTNSCAPLNGPSCSKSTFLLGRRPKLRRLSEKLKNFLTQRDQQHATQFRKLFAVSLTLDEKLISSFSCLYWDYKQERLVPGRLFVSYAHLAFNSNNYSLRFIVSLSESVDGVEKTNEKLLEMNGGIRILLNDEVALTFGSFGSPEKVYALLVRLWQSSERLVGRQQLTSSSHTSQISLIKMGDTSTDGSLIGQTDTTSESVENDNEPATCGCAEHKGSLMLDSVYPLSFSHMFQFLFTNNKMMNEFLISTKRTNINCKSWTETGELSNGKRKRKRTTTYTLELSNSWAAKTSDVTENQTFFEVGSETVEGYVVHKRATNSGVPYADSFTILCTYCITRIDSNSCRMRVHAGLEYRKSIIGMLKGFIERMAMNGVTEYYKSLDDYFRRNIIRIQQHLKEQRVSGGSEFYLSSSSYTSCRSLVETNDGYESDVDERPESSTKRLVKNHWSPAASVAACQTVSPDRSILADIDYKLQLIAFILLLLLFLQFWCFVFPSSGEVDPNMSDLSHLVSHAQNANSAEELQQIFTNIRSRLSN